MVTICIRRRIVAPRAHRDPIVAPQGHVRLVRDGTGSAGFDAARAPGTAESGAGAAAVRREARATAALRPWLRSGLAAPRRIAEAAA